MLYNNYYTTAIENEHDIHLLSDSILKTEDGHKFRVHKYELSKTSPFFYELYRENSTGCGDILIPGMRGSILDVILYYIYTDNLCINDDKLVDLVIACKYFRLENISLKAVEYSRCNMSINNCLPILQAATLMQSNDIIHDSFRYSLIHFEKIMRNSMNRIMNLPAGILKQFVNNKSLGVSNEIVVWQCIVAWVEFDKECRGIHVPEFLLCLKLSDLNEDIAFAIVEHDLVANNRFCTAINELKTSGLFNDYLNLITNFNQLHKVPILEDFSVYRLPSCLYLFTSSRRNGRNRTDYITYDDKLDLWRDTSRALPWTYNTTIRIGPRLYIYETGLHGSLILRCFNFIEDREILVISPEGRVTGYILEHLGFIYVLIKSLSRISVSRRPSRHAFATDFTYIYKRVKVYNPTINVWRDGPSMVSVSGITAASLGRKMYVIGEKLDHDSTAKIVTQAYDPLSDVWELLPSPAVYRNRYALIPYSNKLFMIGGRTPEKRCRAVEAFDPALSRWTTLAILPHTFHCIRAIVVKNQLIVYDRFDINNDPSKCPVMWNNDHQHWISVAPSSPIYELLDYTFNCIDDIETIKTLMMQNRCNADAFVKTPFN